MTFFMKKGHTNITMTMMTTVVRAEQAENGEESATAVSVPGSKRQGRVASEADGTEQVAEMITRLVINKN